MNSKLSFREPTELRACPDCRGTKLVLIQNPSRESVEALCPACNIVVLCDHRISVTIASPHWHPMSELPEKGREIVGITNHGEPYIHPSSTVKPFRPGVVTTHWCYAPEPEDVDGFRKWKMEWMPEQSDETARGFFNAARNAGKEEGK